MQADEVIANARDFMREGKIIRGFKGGVSESELLGSYYGKV